MKKIQTNLRHVFLICSTLLLVACATPNRTLAPSGEFKVGVYPGSPTSIIPGATPADNKGVGHDLGRELARQMGLPFQAVIFSKNADVLDAVKKGEVDATFTNATESRRKDMDFSKTFLRVEQGYLIGPKANIKNMMEIDQSHITIGVSAGSTSQSVLTKQLKNAKIKAANSLKEAAEMLSMGVIQAFATNKAILYELNDQVPGSEVLSGAWGYENFAIGIPKGRANALPYLDEFIDRANQAGTIQRAVQRAGLRGSVPAEEKK